MGWEALSPASCSQPNRRRGDQEAQELSVVMECGDYGSKSLEGWQSVNEFGGACTIPICRFLRWRDIPLCGGRGDGYPVLFYEKSSHADSRSHHYCHRAFRLCKQRLQTTHRSSRLNTQMQINPGVPHWARSLQQALVKPVPGHRIPCPLTLHSCQRWAASPSDGETPGTLLAAGPTN